MLKVILLIVSITVFNVNSYKDPSLIPGRSVMINLFEWKWTDIAKECEIFLGPNGYGGVQVSPPNEHALVEHPFRPWWQRYQPVSYKISSRSGNLEQFKDMVKRCNAVGVRIYVDALINHMAAGVGVGSDGSPYDSHTKYYPSVPYGPNDFNDQKCKTSSGNVENYFDVYQVRNCRLHGLPDLATGSEYVREKLAEFLNQFIDIGVAGFRFDASKHVWPEDLEAIFKRLKNLRTEYKNFNISFNFQICYIIIHDQSIFGPNKKPFIYHEIIDMGNGEPIKSSDYTPLGRVTEYKFCTRLSDTVSKKDGKKLHELKDFGLDFLNSQDSVVFIDNYDSQRDLPIGEVLTFFNPRLYKIANAFMMAWPYAFVQIMSSFKFDKSQHWQGPPSNENGDTKDVLINSDESCGDGWVCEHRWRQIYNMAKFRNVAGDEPVQNWWDNGSNQIAFSRGNKAFLAINNDDYPMNISLQTGLQGGFYCDIVSGKRIKTKCTGKKIFINSDGVANISITNTDDDPFVAIHIESKL